MDITESRSALLSTMSSMAERLQSASSKTDAEFSTVFADELQLKKEKVADYVSGSIGVDLNNRGMPSRFVFFDESGDVLTKRPFTAPALLEATEKFDIPLTDLEGLGAQLDAEGVGYRPYELYGRGSDHGLDFQDLMNGGLGTAYDWRVDTNAHLKGPSAVRRLEEANDLAARLSLQPNPEVTNVGQMYGAGPKSVMTSPPSSTSSNAEVELMSVLQNIMSNLSGAQKANFLEQLKQIDTSTSSGTSSGLTADA